MAKKTWEEKFNSAGDPVVKVNENGFADIKPGQTMLLTTPKHLDAFIGKIPKGNSLSMKDLRLAIAAENNAEMSCPVVTGIHLRTIAEIVSRKLDAGISAKNVTPVWRVIEPGAPITKKLESGPDTFMKLRGAEGLST